MIFDNELVNKRVALECKGFVRYLGTLIDNHNLFIFLNSTST